MRRITIEKPEKIKQQILDYFQESAEHKFAYKLQAILLLLDNEHTNCSEVARIYGTSPQAIAKWVRQLNEGKGNIEALKNRPKFGRNTRLSKKDMRHIKDVLTRNPAVYGIQSNRWDGITLSAFLKKEMGIELKVRQCQRVLNRLGVANKSGRPWNKLPE